MSNIITKYSEFLLILEFTFDKLQKQIRFKELNPKAFPFTEKEYELEDFLTLTATCDKEFLKKFFNAATPQSNLIATFKEKTENGRSCSANIIFLPQQDGSIISGLIQNISPFMFGGYNYSSLKKVIDSIPQARKITHDLNNQYQIISGFSSAIEDEVEDPELKEFAKNVMDAVAKSIDLNKEFRTLFPPKDPPKLFTSTYLSSSCTENNLQVNETTEEKVIEKEILVIDDEPLVRKFLCAMIKRLDFIPLGVGTGKEAIEAVKKGNKTFSLAIMDMNLPDIDSEELFNKLREASNEIKIIIVSGEPITEVSQRLLDNGASGYMQKPATVKVLSAAIKKALE